MISLGALCSLPLVNAVSRQIMAPIAQAMGSDRLPDVQYTHPPGDPGWFGPGSVTWRVHGDPSMLVGGLSALLLQTLHPLAMAGIADHSNYRKEPLRRLARTSSFVTGTTYGSSDVADRLTETIKAIHRRVRGTAPDGRPYSADEPELITWVHVTEVASFLRAHQRFVPFPVRGELADRYFHEMAIVAQKLGASDVPRSRVAVRAYFRGIRPELEASEQALDAIRFLTAPMRRPPNPFVGIAHQIVVQAAVSLLPSWARMMLGVRQPAMLDWAMVRPATHLIMGTLRFAGGTPGPIAEARRRCAAEPIRRPAA